MQTTEDAQRPDTHWREISRGRDEILNVRAEIERRRSALPAMLDTTGRFLTGPVFFAGFLLFHLLWVGLNLPVWPWPPWDPYPFIFLATLTSAEAPFLALLILMYQQRNARIDELRGEIDLQVCLHLERELSMVLRLLREVQEKLQVDSQQNRQEVQQMEDYLDPNSLMEELRRDLERAEGNDGLTSP